VSTIKEIITSKTTHKKLKHEDKQGKHWRTYPWRYLKTNNKNKILTKTIKKF
jgi:hypothetical protein